MEELIDVTTELRQGLEFKPKVALFETTQKDFEAIEVISLGASDRKKVKSKAEKSAEETRQGLSGEFADQAAEVEFRRCLIYWAVVYGLAIDEKPAYRFYDRENNVRLDINHMINYVEYRLGLEDQAFEELGLEIIRLSKLDGLLAKPEQGFEL